MLPFRSHGARLLGGRELLSGPWFNQSHTWFEIHQQPHRQPTQRLHLQSLEVGVVSLAEAMGVQVHGGRSQGWAIVFHTRTPRGKAAVTGRGR